MKVLRSTNAQEDLKNLVNSSVKNDAIAGALLDLVLTEIENHSTLSWDKIAKHCPIEIIQGITINGDHLAHLSKHYQFDLFRLKAISSTKGHQLAAYRIAVGQPSKAPKKLGILAIFPKINDGEEENGYEPYTTWAARIEESCKELGIPIRIPSK